MTTFDGWMLAANLLIAIGTVGALVISWRASKKATTVEIAPQPVEVKVTEELHKRFADKDAFHEHCRDNEKQREKLHGRIDDVVADYNQKFQNLPGEIVALLRHTGALK